MLRIYFSAVFFVAENTLNFAQCCVNSPRISEKFSFDKIEEEKGEKVKKNCCSRLLESATRTLLSLKKPGSEINFFCCFSPRLSQNDYSRVKSMAKSHCVTVKLDVQSNCFKV